MLDNVQQMDQVRTAIENQAILVAQYYQRLQTEGITEPLLHDLIVQMAGMMWAKTFGVFGEGREE